MSMRIFNLLLVLGVTACGSAQTSNGPAPVVAADDAQTVAETPKTLCAVDGARAFTAVCDVERVEGDDGLTLTLRHPSGGFRRLRVTKDGRGVIAADGAEPAVVASLGVDLIEVTVGTDRYRLPATVKR